MWLKFGSFAAIGIAVPIFLVAIIDYGLAMITLAVASIRTARPWRGPMLGEVARSAVAATFQQM